MGKRERAAKRTTRAPILGRSAGRTQAGGSHFRLLVILGLAVAILVTITHWPALSAKAMSFDDREYLLENRLVQDPGGESVGRFLGEVLHPSTVRGYYQPLTMISLMLDHASGGRPDNLRPFHRTNLLLHVLNTALVIALIYLLFGQPIPAALVGLLFGVHPLTAESIPWLAERKTLLASFFALWSLVLYVRYARQGGWKSLTASAVVFALALMSKPTTIALPALLLLLDCWPLRRLGWRTLMEKVPHFALAGVSAVITIISQARTSVATMPGERSAMEIVLVLCHNVVFYLSKIFCPTELSSHYPYPQPLDLSEPSVAAGVVGTLLLLAVLAVSLRWTRALLVGWLFLFVAIFPTLGIISFTDTIAALRFAYFPMVGLLLLCAAALCWWWTRWEGEAVLHSRRLAAVVLVVVLVLAEVVGTRGYLRHWRDTQSLYAHMLSIAPEAPTLRYNMGVMRLQQGSPAEAIDHFNRVLQTQPDFAAAHCDLGGALHQVGRSAEAVSHLQEALRLDSSFTRAHANLGLILGAQRRFEEAAHAYREALSIDPTYAVAHKGIADLLFAQGKIQEAIESYRRAVQLQPRSASAHYDLGSALGRQGDYQRAVAHFTEAVRINPQYVEAHFARGYALELQGSVEQAIAQYRHVLQLSPNHTPARRALAAAVARQNQPGQP